MCTKRELKNKNIYLTLLFVIATFFFGYGAVNAATLQINSSTATIFPGETTTLYVVLNSEGVAVNNAEATINFPPDLLEVLSVSKSGSVFSLWVEEPFFSNTSGVVTFNGGIPTPGFNGSKGPVVSIVVRAKKIGQADFLFATGSVRANDGFGTDVLSSKQGKSISVIKKEETVIPPPVPDNIVKTTLQITSDTHPNQTDWYQDRTAEFKWVVPAGFDSVLTAINNNDLGTPRVVYSPAISKKIVKDLEDGVWYFKVRARKSGVLSPVSTYIVRIDATIPEKKEVVFSYDNATNILNVAAEITDSTSGIDYYELFVDGVLIKNIPAKEFVNGNYKAEFSTPGEHSVTIIAFDHAGNSVESSGVFQVDASLSVMADSDAQLPEAELQSPLLITIGSYTTRLVSLILPIISGLIFLLIGAYYVGRKHHQLQHATKVREALAKGDNVKILSLLKKRLEKHLEILQRTRHTRILTKEEKEIKEAIEGDLDEVDRAIEQQNKK